MTWRQQILAVLKVHMSESAAEAAAALLGAFYATERICAGKTDEQAKGAVMQMLVDLTFGLPSNGWWKQNGAFVMPVFATAVNAWMDSLVYFTMGKDKEPYAISTRAVIMEVASACLLVDKGVVQTREHSRLLRDQLAAVRMEQ